MFQFTYSSKLIKSLPSPFQVLSLNNLGAFQREILYLTLDNSILQVSIGGIFDIIWLRSVT